MEWALERQNVDVRQNMRRYTVEWRLGGEWTEMTGRAAAWIRAEIESAYVVEE